jgi:hypothetical protein
MEGALKAGDGPFRAKGLVYTGMLDYYDHGVRGGRAAVLAALAPELRAFCGQSFLRSAMYDVLPMNELSAAAARVNGQSHFDLVRDTSRWIANRDIGTFFKLLLRLTSVETLVMRMPKVTTRYFDFGDARAQMLGPGRCESFQWGIPRPVAAPMAAAAEVFTEVAVRQAGARDVRVRASPPEQDGERYGLETVRIRFLTEWS